MSKSTQPKEDNPKTPDPKKGPGALTSTIRSIMDQVKKQAKTYEKKPLKDRIDPLS